MMWPQTPPTLLPLWEKVARTKFAPDEGSLSVHSVESVARGGKPLTRSSLGRPADLPSPTRGEGATMRSARLFVASHTIRLTVEHGTGRRFVRDKAVDDAPGERRANGRHLCMSKRGADGRRLRGGLRRNGGEALVGAALDQPALGVIGPSGDFAGRAEPHHLEQLFAGDEAIDMNLRLLIHLSDPDQTQIGFRSDRLHLGNGLDAHHAIAFVFRRHQKWQRHRIVPRAGAVSEASDRIEEA